MPYDLHITRKKFWADPGNDISEAEWRAVVEGDGELEPEPASEKGASAARWTGQGAQADAVLYWFFGNVIAGDPNRPLIDKMVALAQGLGASVQGVSGEPYHLCDTELSYRAEEGFLSRIASLFKRTGK